MPPAADRSIVVIPLPSLPMDMTLFPIRGALWRWRLETGITNFRYVSFVVNKFEVIKPVTIYGPGPERPPCASARVMCDAEVGIVIQGGDE